MASEDALELLTLERDSLNRECELVGSATLPHGVVAIVYRTEFDTPTGRVREVRFAAQTERKHLASSILSMEHVEDGSDAR